MARRLKPIAKSKAAVKAKPPGKVESGRTVEARRSRQIEARGQARRVAKNCISGDGGAGEKTSTSVKTD